MTAPDVDPPAEAVEDLAAIALANVEGIQKLPHFEADEHTGTDAGLIDFSLLGGTEDAADSAA